MQRLEKSAFFSMCKVLFIFQNSRVSLGFGWRFCSNEEEEEEQLIQETLLLLFPLWIFYSSELDLDAKVIYS